MKQKKLFNKWASLPPPNPQCSTFDTAQCDWILAGIHCRMPQMCEYLFDIKQRPHMFLNTTYLMTDAFWWAQKVVH